MPAFAAAYAIQSLGHQAANWTAWRGTWLLADAYIDQQLTALRAWERQELTP